VGFVLNRRQLLAKAALVAATLPAGRLLGGDWRLSRQSRGGLAVPMNLELVTVTDTRAILTWFTGDPTQLDEFGRPAPVAAPGRVLLGEVGDPAGWEEVARHEPTAYHYVEIDGLRPGTSYAFLAESGGLAATPTLLRPDQLLPSPYDPGTLDTSHGGVFRTLTPPPGEEILRLAWTNDMHYGELISGIVTGDVGGERGFPPGFPVDPDNPYWRFMGRAAVDEAIGRGAELLMVNGDLTNAAEPEALEEIKAELDRFGRLGGTRQDRNGDFLVRAGGPRAYWVTRGNHDRAFPGEQYSGGTPVPGTHLYDTFHATFKDGFAPGATTSRFGVVVEGRTSRWRFVGLDSNYQDQTGVLAEEELEYLDAQLERSTEPTIVLLHHPAGDANNLIAFPPGMAGLDWADARAFRGVLGDHLDRVIGVYQGHTHRNNHTVSATTGSVPFFEGGATKEYPGGYTIVRLFEGGYMVNFYKTADPEARAWSERSRGQFLGLYPYYTLGGLGDRNWVFDVDARTTSTPEGPGNGQGRGNRQGAPDHP
jgi:3',5'-cyclic-AMP phosphodiesterase